MKRIQLEITFCPLGNGETKRHPHDNNNEEEEAKTLVGWHAGGLYALPDGLDPRLDARRQAQVIQIRSISGLFGTVYLTLPKVHIYPELHKIHAPAV